MLNQEKLCHSGLNVIEIEAQGIQALASRLDHNFAKACEYMLQCQGRIIVLGMGKSGHIGRKIAATFASTGTPAFFVHPAEASHGDLGMITKSDVILALSNSGETEELLTILPMIKRLSLPLITMTGNIHSTLAKASDAHLDVYVEKEACSLGLAPTSSTTAMLVMGDALAIALLDTRGFTKDDFARSHPKGLLGKRLLLYIDDLMHTGSKIPKVSMQATISEALMEMTQKGLGMTTIVDNQDTLCGIYTDGDLRRTLDKGYDLHKTQISSVMTTNSKKIPPGMLAFDALQIMETFKITSLVVTKDDKHIDGIIHIHDLFRAGVK